MQDLIGRTLGHYRIVEKIGEGGMGVVYRAHDERLDRDVAIKVLPEAVAKDKARLARFEREAKLLASLNHQNIATLHGFEEHEGQRFLVMELAEGETLAERIKKGPIPVDDALDFARQIAKGLEAAHEYGIIHRDLKPANVMVSPEGKVKVLDFGLAKAFDPKGSGPQSPESLAESPTLTAEMTREGVLLGTAAYMSPEQARGEAVDKRADIWAFGCTLYEMLTGTRPFGGTSSTDVLAAIIKEDPDWDVLPAETSGPVRRLLRRCLTKDPRDRIHDIADARIELQSLSVDGQFESEQAIRTVVTHRLRAWLPWGLVAVVTAVAVGVVGVSLQTRPSSGVTRMQLGLEPAERLGSSGGAEWAHEIFRLSRTAIAISPDGRHLVFSAGDDTGSRLHVRALDEGTASPIPGTEGGVGPIFSPDGERIGFWADGQFKKVRIDGGPPMPLCDAPTPPYGACWGTNDSVYVGQRHGGILRVTADGGSLEEITDLTEGELGHYHPQLLPDGETLLFSTIGWGDWEDTTIMAQSLKTGDRKILVENGSDAQYAPTGHLLFARLGALIAVPFDLKRMEVTGGEVVVLENVRHSVNAAHTRFNTYSAQFTLSAAGTLVFVPGGIWPDREASLVWVDLDGNVEPLSVQSGPYAYLRSSPDGTRVVVGRFGFAGLDIWVYDILRGTLTRMTFGESKAIGPLWTPDGSRITFCDLSIEGSQSRIDWIPADGSGVPEALVTDVGTHIYPSSWSPDGQALAFVVCSETPATCDIWLLPLGGEPRPFIASPFSEKWPAFSPDGRWLAYASNQSGRHEVYVTPYPGPGPKIQISSDGGQSPAWAPNGRELFFRSLRDGDRSGAMMVVGISTKPNLSIGKCRVLFTGDYQQTTPVRGYDLSPDGKRFLMGRRVPWVGEPVTQLHVTLNWFDELKRLAPTE